MKATLPLLLLLLLVFSACRSNELVDEETGVVMESVALMAQPGASEYVPVLEGPLRALSVSPNGPMAHLQKNQAISITLSKPMVPLGDAPPVPAGMFELSPAIPGTLQWEGSQILVFRPDAPLPLATRFSVTLNTGLSSLEGEPLSEPVSWTFETPRPQLMQTEPEMGSSQTDPQQAIELVFSQAIQQSGMEDKVVLIDVQANSPLPVSISWASDSTLVVRPENPLAKRTSYRLIIASGVTGRYGPLPSTPISFAFSTYPDLALESVFQPLNYYDQITDNFDPARGISLTFSTPVKFGDLRQALTLAPVVEWPAGIEARDNLISQTHRLPFLWEPEARYTMQIAGLLDQYGQELVSHSTSFRTAAYTPSMNLPSGLLVVEAEEATVLPLRVTNVPAINYGLDAIPADAIVPAIRTYYRGYYGGDGATRPLIPASQQLSLEIINNKPAVLPFSLTEGLTEGTGIVGINARPGGNVINDGRTFQALVQVTRLGISAKFSPHQNLVLVTDLKTATPVAGARVFIRDEQNIVKWDGVTDESGKAISPGWSALGIEPIDEWTRPRQFVIVEHMGDIAFTGSHINPGLEPYRFGVNYDWNPKPLTTTGSIFTDRGLYRAGESVHVKGILRQKTDGDWESMRDSVRVLLISPREELVYDERFLLSDMGSFHFTWDSRSSASLGSYTVRVVHTSDEEAENRDLWDDGDIARGSFRVDAFRRATFAVEQQTSADAYIAGDFMDATITGRYLFGAPMQNQPVYYSAYRQSGSFRPAGYEGYRFSDYNSGLYALLENGDTSLDEQGQLSFRTPLPGNPAGGPAKIVFEATVTDPSRQQTSARKEITLHPGLYYLGIKPQTTFLDLSSEEDLSVDLIAIDPAGFSVAASDVQLRLVRRQWNSVREIGSDGRLRWRSEMIEEEKLNQTLSIDEGSARRLRLPVTEGGSYFIEATGQDLRGNTIKSKAYFYATGGGYVAWSRSDDNRIELTPERTEYRPGEQAVVMVQSPYEEAQALITIEREGILDSWVETLTGSTPKIEIPLTEKHLPNIYVSVMLLTGRTAPPSGAIDVGAPTFKIGYTSLTVDPGVRHAQVEIIPNQETYRPGEQVQVELQLNDAEGNGIPGEITFSAADAGVLNLIGYQLPDPFGAFYGPRLLGVSTSQSLSHLVKQRSFGQKEEDEGGGGGMDDQAGDVRKDFRPLAHWAPALRTNAQGRATVTFTLPESLTTFRLMATAHTTDHKFGNGSTDVVVTKPLVMKPALPRFARLNDSFEAGVLVTNTTGEAGEAEIRVVSSNISITGDATQTVSLADGETKEVRFSWDATTLEEPVFTFEAELEGERDALEVSIPVLLPTIKQASATLASTEDEAAEAFQLPEGFIQERGQFEAKLSSTVLVGLDGATDYLFAYPYGCLEQRTSRIRPLLAADNLIENYDLSVLGGDRDSLITDWLGMLKDFWTGNGFSLWQGGYYVSPYTSAYTVLGMAEAAAAGYRVEQGLMLDALNYLEFAVKNNNEKPQYLGQRAWSDTRALMLYALARHGRVLESEINDLAGQITRSPGTLSAGGRSHLLRSVNLASTRTQEQHRANLVDGFIRQLTVEPTSAYLRAPGDPDYYWIFASDTRETAFGLTALLESAPPSDIVPILEKMVRYLIDSRQNGHWASTQENMAVIEALNTYHTLFETTNPSFTAEVLVAGQSLLNERFEGRSLARPSASQSIAAFSSGQQIPVEIRKQGAGKVYYTLLLETYSTGAVPAQNQGLQVERRIQKLDQSGNPSGPVMLTGGETLRLEAGELIQVSLRVQSNADRNYVVIDDALPAGLEPVNAAFGTTQEALADQTGGSRWWGSFNHTEMRDDRVLLFADYLTRGEHTYTYVARASTPGTYVHPPVQGELMYQPEIRGQNASGVLEVVPPSSPIAGN